MQDNVTQNTTQKTIRIDDSLIDSIEKLAAESERDFSSQVRFMLKEYLRIKESR
jgi:hypothetical protein